MDPPDGHAWTVIACDGGEFSPSYGVFNLFQPDGSVYSSAPGRSEDVNIVLRYEGPGPFTLTGVTCVAPSAGFTSPLGQAVLFTSWDMPDVRRLNARWSHVSSQQQFDALAAQHHAQQHKDMQRWVSVRKAQRPQAPAPASPCPPPPSSHQGSGLLAGTNPSLLAGANRPSHAAVARQQAAGRLALLLAAATADDARSSGHASSSSSSSSRDSGHGALTPGMSAAAGVSAAASALAMCYGWEATWRVHMQALAMQMQAHVQAQMVAAQAMQAHVQAHAQAMHSLQAQAQPQGLQQPQMQLHLQLVPPLQQPQVLQTASMLTQLHAQPLQVHQPTSAAQLAAAVQLPHMAMPGLASIDSMPPPQQQLQQQLQQLQHVESQTPYHPQLQLQVQPAQIVAQPWHQIPLTPHPPLAQHLQPLTLHSPMQASPQQPTLQQQQQQDHMPQAAAPNHSPGVTLPRVSSKTLDVPAAASSPPAMATTDVVMAAIPPRWSWDVLDPDPAQNRPRSRHWSSRETGTHGAAEDLPMGGRWGAVGAGARLRGAAYGAGVGAGESSGEEDGDDEGEGGGAPSPWSTTQLLHANRNPHPASHSPGRRPHQVRLHATHGLLPPASDAAGNLAGLLPFSAGGMMLRSSSASDGSSEGGHGSSADRDGSSDGNGGSSAEPMELSLSEELPSPWSTLTSTLASASPTLRGPLHPLTLASPLRPLRPELHQQHQHQQLQQLQQYQQQYLQQLQQLRQEHAGIRMGLPAGVLPGQLPAAAQLPFSHPPHPNSGSSNHRGGSSGGAGCSSSSEDMEVDVPLPPSPPCPAAFIDLLDCSHATVAVDPPLSGRYVLIKLLRSRYTYADNLDTTFLGLHVQRGPHAFGSVECA